MVKIDRAQLLEKIDLLDGRPDRQYFGLPLYPSFSGEEGGKADVTSGICLAHEAVYKGNRAAEPPQFFNPNGQIFDVDCTSLFERLQEITEVAARNPVYLQTMKLPAPEASDAQIEEYVALDRVVKALLMGGLNSEEPLAALFASVDHRPIDWQDLP